MGKKRAREEKFDSYANFIPSDSNEISLKVFIWEKKPIKCLNQTGNSCHSHILDRHIRDDDGDTRAGVAEMESVGAACGQTHECRPWTPPSIWADMVRFSNLSSPEYIMDLVKPRAAHKCQKKRLDVNLLGHGRQIQIYRRMDKLFAPMS